MQRTPQAAGPDLGRDFIRSQDVFPDDELFLSILFRIGRLCQPARNPQKADGAAVLAARSKALGSHS
jgi:hypothetical protein